MKASLNGGKTRPLRPASINILRMLSASPMIRCCINPGIVDRLTREDLAEEVMLSVDRSSRGMVAHLQITDAGVEALKSLSGKSKA